MNSSNNFGGTDYNMGGQQSMNSQRSNMNRQARPQSIDPNRSSNIQAHNFGGMGMQNQHKPNDDNFFGNSGMKSGQMGSSNTNGDDIDWGL